MLCYDQAKPPPITLDFKGKGSQYVCVGTIADGGF